MDQLGLEDLEVDQRVDLLRTRTRGFNQRPQYYTPIIGLVKGVTSSGESCCFTHLTLTIDIECKFLINSG